jgi:hypothetical protein
MDKFQIANEHYKLERFHYGLTLVLFSGLLIFTAVILPLVISLPIISLVVLGLSAYVIWSLIQLEKKGWIIGYVVVMGVPVLFAIFLSSSEIVGNAVWFFPLCVFYFYCWILRHSIVEWLSDLGDPKAFELRDKHEKKIQDMLEKHQKDSFKDSLF